MFPAALNSAVTPGLQRALQRDAWRAEAPSNFLLATPLCFDRTDWEMVDFVRLDIEVNFRQTYILTQLECINHLELYPPPTKNV